MGKSKSHKRERESSEDNDHLKKKKRKKTKHRKRESSMSSDSDVGYTHSISKKSKKKRKHSHSVKKSRKSDKGLVGPSVEPGSSMKLNNTAVRCKKPMTKEEWEKQQNEVKRVFDPDTGRMRLVKGSGEIVEEIVSKEQQRQINKLATLGDGVSFSRQTGLL